MEVDELFQAQRQLSEKDFAIYNAELQKKTKNIGLAYFLLLFFGGIGLHKFYIGKVGQGIAYFFISLLYLIVFEFVIFNSGLYWHPTPFFYGFISILSIFLFYDLFTLSKQISEYDKNIRIDLLAQFGIIIPKKENEQKIKFNEKEIIDFFNILSHYANKLIDLIYNLQDSIKIPLLIFSLYEINWFFDLRFEDMFVFNLICTIFVALALILTYSLLDAIRKYIFIVVLLTIVLQIYSQTAFLGILTMICITWLSYELIDFILLKLANYNRQNKSNVYRGVFVLFIMLILFDESVVSSEFFQVIFVILSSIVLYFFNKFYNINEYEN